MNRGFDKGFHEGDVVRLKAGGPVMVIDTVSEEAERKTALCTWFNEDKQEFRVNRFSFQELKKETNSEHY